MTVPAEEASGFRLKGLRVSLLEFSFFWVTGHWHTFVRIGVWAFAGGSTGALSWHVFRNVPVYRIAVILYVLGGSVVLR